MTDTSPFEDLAEHVGQALIKIDAVARALAPPPPSSPVRPFRCGACGTHHGADAITQLRCGLYRCLPCFEDLRGLCHWPDRERHWHPLGPITMQASLPSTIVGAPLAQPFARSLRLRERDGRPLPADGKARAVTED